MKKIYLLLVLCCMGYMSNATLWYSAHPGRVDSAGCWNTLIGGGGTICTSFANPADTFECVIGMHINPDSTWSVAGVVYCTNGGHISKSQVLPTSALPSTINVGKDLILIGGSSITSAITATGTLTLNLYGNLTVGDTSLIFTSGLVYNYIHFKDTTGVPQIVTWTSTRVSNYTGLIVDKRAVVQLGSNVPVPQNANIADSVNGTLMCGTYTISSSNTDSFAIGDSAFIYTAHTGGLDSSIQKMTARHFSKKANYIYNGVAPQVTGFTLPDSIFNVANSGSVTINNRTGVTLSSALTFQNNAKLNLELGVFTIGSLLTMNGNSWVRVDTGNFASAPTYFFPVTVSYENLGYNALAVTTGNELLPTIPATTIGSFLISKPGATITLGSSFTTVVVDIDSSGAYLFGIPILDASTSNYSITTKSWTNNPGAGGFNARGGTVTFINSPTPGMSTIFGATVFNNVTLNNSAGLSLANVDETINNQLTLTSGRLIIDDKNLIIGPSAPAVAGAFSASTDIVADSTGQVQKQYSANGAFMFPVGDSLNYSPITLNFSGSTFSPGAYAAVKLRNHKHPQNANVSNYINRYWSVATIGITSTNYTVAAIYVPGDVVGTEGNMSMGQYPLSLPWIKFAPTNVATHTLSTVVPVTNLFSDFSGISSAGPSVVSTHDTNICIPSGAVTLTAVGSGDPTLNYTWSPALGLSTTTGTVTIATPSVTTTYTVTLTDGNGFTATATTKVTVNPRPSLDSASSSSPACVGDILLLSANNPLNVTGYAWSGPVAISTGATTQNASVVGVTTAAAGTYSVTVNDGTGPGCSVTYTTTAVVNPLPAPAVASGGGTFCDSAVIAATNGGDGTMYYQGTTSGGISTILGTSPKTVLSSGTYYFRAKSLAGCWGTQASVTVTINPLPLAYTVTGSGHFCSGSSGEDVGLNGSDTGIHYQLYLNGVISGAAVAGTGSPLDFGVKTVGGHYTVWGTNIHTGCSGIMFDSAVVVRDSLPTIYALTGTGPYCAGSPGSDLVLNNSDLGISYQLWRGGVIVPSAMMGTLSPLDFGNQVIVGPYYVIATDTATACTSTMADTITVSINPLPNLHTVSGGGTDCFGDPGFAILMNGSDTGITYQLDTNGVAITGVNLAGTGNPLNFGIQPYNGTYTVKATNNHTGCFDTMSGTGVIVVRPAPVQYTVTGGGAYCVNDTIPYHIGLATSDTGFMYQLYNGLTAVGAPKAGTGAALDYGAFTAPGVYTIKGTNDTTGCTGFMGNSVAIVVNSVGGIFNVSGGGSYCATGPGIELFLSGSELGVEYQVYNGVIADGTPVLGTGAPISLGFHTGAGTYTAQAITLTGSCVTVMTGSGTIVVLPLPTPYAFTGGGQSCVPGTTYDLVLAHTDTGISYQLYRGLTAIGGPVAGTGSANDYGSFSTPGTYKVIATNNKTGCVNNMADSQLIIVNPLPNVDTLTGGGTFCSDDTGRHMKLNGSDIGINYQLYDDGTPVGSPVAGTGNPLDFGLQTAAGFYTVVAVNAVTGCTNNMFGSPLNIVHPTPAVYTIAGGGGYCSGDTGAHIYLSASNAGIRYQLYRGITPVGAPKNGTGFALDYGLFTTAGTYKIIATDTTTGCVSNMFSTVTISINSRPLIYNVTGGGTYCAGGSGFAVGLDSSNAGIRYQLYNGFTAVGSPVAGTGHAISFGTLTAGGTYRVIATDVLTLCASNMNDSAIIKVNPLPTVHTVTGTGTFCEGGSGLHVGLNGSDTGVTYRLYFYDTTAVGGPVAGTDTAIDLGVISVSGVYTVRATNNTTGCSLNMSGSAIININPAPARYAVNGGGTYCTADTGVHVGLAGSNTGITYQLYLGVAPIGSPVTGTGGTLDFGLQTGAGLYTVVATNNTTLCTANMFGSVSVSVIPFSVPVVTVASHPASAVIGVGQLDTLVATIISGGGGSPAIQWLINGNPVSGATSDTFVFSVYFDNDSILCNVTSSGPCGGVTTSKLTIVHLTDVGVQQIIHTAGDVRLIPNPNKGVFMLKGTMGSQDDEEVSLEVTNMMGQVVYKNKVMTHNGAINEQIQLNGSLTNGMYILNLRSGTENTVFHFVVEQ